jgi:predicted O-methyltransferase YrrM
MPEQQLPDITKQALAASLKAQDQLLKSNKRLDAAVANCEKNHIPRIAISPLQGQFLALLCRMSNAQNVLEVGTLGGYSTIWFAESVPGIKVTSIEFNSKHRDVAVENTKDLDNVDIRLGAAIDIMPKLAKEGKVFDFVFIDANWDMQAQYFDQAVKMTRKAGTIYVDNVVRNLLDDEKDGDVADWSLIEHVKSDSRVDATLIPTLSTHKVAVEEMVDGFVLAIVK